MKHRGDLGVSVLRQYWNKGIGSQLLHKVINFAKENSFEVIDLQVRSDNFSAIHQQVGLSLYLFVNILTNG